MDSSPVCGVEIANAALDPLLAPCFRSPAATGITAHEHNGSGIPSSDAFKIGTIPFPPRCLSIHSRGTRTWTTPARRKPKINQTDDSVRIIQSSAKNCSMKCIPECSNRGRQSIPFHPDRRQSGSCTPTPTSEPSRSQKQRGARWSGGDRRGVHSSQYNREEDLVLV